MSTVLSVYHLDGGILRRSSPADLELVEERDFVSLAAAMQDIVRSPFAFREMGALASESGLRRTL